MAEKPALKARHRHLIGRKLVRRRILIPLLLIPVFVISLYNTVELYTQITGMMMSRRDSVASLASVSLKARLDALILLGTAQASREPFRDFVAAGRWEEAVQFLGGMLEKWPYIERVFIADKAGILMSDLPAAPETRGKDFSYREWYQKVSREWQPAISSVYQRTAEPQHYVIAVAVPIESQPPGSITGILVMQVRLSMLLDWSRDIQPLESGLIYFTDSKGQVVAHPEHSKDYSVTDFSKVPAVSIALKGKKGVGVFFNSLQNKKLLVAYQPVPGYGWTVIFQENARKAFLPRRSILTRVILLDAAVLLLTFFFAWWIASTLRALEDSENRFRVVVETAQDAIITADYKGRIVRWNEAAKKLFGYELAEVVGKPLTVIMPERFREAHSRGFERLQQTGQSRLIGKSIELAGQRRDGSEFPLELSLSQWKTQDEIYFTGIIRNLTERRDAEKMVLRKNEQLARSRAELEYMQLFAFSATHDMQEPLHKIIAFSDALRTHATKLEPASQQNLDRIQEAALRMRAMMEQLKALSRISTSGAPFEIVDLGAALKQVLQDLEPYIRDAGAEIHSATLPKVSGDRDQLRMLLQNLMINALKFRDTHRKLIVEIRSETVKRPSQDFIKITLQDNGVGFDEKFLDKMFQPFQRLHTRQEYPGSGMGLAICRHIMLRHGGSIMAEGRPGQGSTFIFELPAL